MTLVDLPGTSLDTVYTYEDVAVPWSQGRLTRISRGETVVDYRYDRFGRTTQDGALSYVYDENGDPLEIVYPGGVRAVYTYLVPGRPKSLVVKRDGEPDLTLVEDASYLPFGPLKTLELVGSLTETQAYSNRYFPNFLKMAAAGDKLHWDYSTDAVGNVTSIQQLQPTPTLARSYAYQDFAYFLTCAAGRWAAGADCGTAPPTGQPLLWTYDKIGNRLSETRAGLTDTYTYPPSGGGGHTPILEEIDLGTGVTRAYDYGPAGHLGQVEVPGNTVTEVAPVRWTVNG